MNNVAHQQSHTQEIISRAEAWRRLRDSEALIDIIQRVLSLAPIPPRARSLLLALIVILKPGETRKVSHAALSLRLERDISTAGRYVDALVKWQTASGYTFVKIKRCTRKEKKPAIFSDRWYAIFCRVVMDALIAGEEIDVWLAGVKPAEQPGNLAREAVARRIFDQIPWKTPPEVPALSPEDAELVLQESTRHKIAQLEDRIREVFDDAAELAKINPFAVSAEFAKIREKVLPECLSKTERKVSDLAFRSRFPEPAHHDEGEQAAVVSSTCSTNDPEHALSCAKCTSPNGETKEVTAENSEKTVFAYAEPKFITETDEPEPLTPADRREFALDYASRGRRILPVWGVTEAGVCRCGARANCESPGKHPALPKDWQLLATTNEATINGWWTANPHANLGWLMGNGYLCLDYDGKKGKRLYKAMKTVGLLPATLEAITGSGGRHVIYSTPHNFISRVRLMPGLDIRSDRTQIVIAPSVSNKGPYRWDSDGPQEPVALPPELLAWLQKRFNHRAQKKLSQQVALPPASGYYSQGISFSNVPEGQRNDTMYGYLSGRRNSIADDSIIRAIAYQKNLELTKPMSQRELEKIINSVLTLPTRDPQPVYV